MTLLKELFRLRRYKTSQGRLIRRLTMIGIWVLFAVAAWKCTQLDHTWLENWVGQPEKVIGFSLGGVITLFGLWIGFRLVNWATFTDFLISVESEMAKVSWPSKAELRSSTMVVLTVFVLLAGMIYIYDLVLVFFFGLIGVM